MKSEKPEQNTRVENDPKTKEDHNEINEMIKSIQRTSMDIKNISNSPPPVVKFLNNILKSVWEFVSKIICKTGCNLKKGKI